MTSNSPLQRMRVALRENSYIRKLSTEGKLEYLGRSTAKYHQFLELSKDQNLSREARKGFKRDAAHNSRVAIKLVSQLTGVIDSSEIREVVNNGMAARKVSVPGEAI